MARTLTKKQRKFVNEYADTGNGTLAVKEAGYAVKDDKSAGVIAWENLGKERIQEELKKLGFDSNNAKRVVGEILNKEDAEDRDRLKAAETVFKVTGDFAPEKHLNVNVETQVTPELKKLADGLLHRQKDT